MSGTSDNSGVKARLSRRKFLLGSAATAAGAAVTMNSERADAFFNLMGFMKKPAGNGQTSNGYVIGQSLMTKGNGWLSRSLGATYTDQSRSSHSFWMKRAAISLGRETDVGVGYLCLGPGSYLAGDALWIGSNNGSPYTYTTAAFRDPSAWYHILITYDYNATSGNRVKLYINGVQYTNWYSYGEGYSMGTFGGTGGMPWGSGGIEVIGSAPNGPSNTNYMFDGYLAEIHAIDGQVLPPTAFGEVDSQTGQWIPKKYTGTYGIQGHYLNFSNSADLGQDSSGNGNHFSVNTYTAANQCIDTPTNNFCTWSPLDRSTGAGAMTVSNGNLTAISTSATRIDGVYSTIALSSGKFYYETYLDTRTPDYPSSGICAVDFDSTGGGWAYYGGSNNAPKGAGIRPDGTFYINGTNSNTSGLTWSSGEYVRVAIDFTNKLIWFGRGASWHSGDPALGAGGTSFAAQGGTAFKFQMCLGDGGKGTVNLGQGGQTGLVYDAASGGRFKYTPPAGFKALSTANLPAPAIKNSSQHFHTVLRTGTGAAYSVSSLTFKPDLVWVKNRSSSVDHLLFDSARGVNKYLVCDDTVAETNDATSLSSFNANGYSGGANVTLNANGASYVDWFWKKGASAGFDIQTFNGNGTNQTVSHSLGTIPSLVIVKSRNADGAWPVYHGSTNASPQGGYILFNPGPGFFVSDTTVWNNTAPTSSQFSVGSSSLSNTSGTSYIAYLWAEVPGFSKFGSYTGNNSSDGPFVYCGFKPKYVWLRATTNPGAPVDWWVYDGVRDSYNPAQHRIPIDGPAGVGIAEVTNAIAIDILSNGFKIRTTHISHNASGVTYIFAAFAEAPFKYANAR